VDYRQAGGAMGTFGTYLFIAAVGFVSAGTLASFAQLVSGQPARFNLMPNSFAAALGGVLFSLVAGPAIVMRNAWHGLRKKDRPAFWFGLSALIAGLWSLFSGCLLLAVIFCLN